MYWIEPITDPEVLKLGIRMALYREKKPDKKQCKNQHLEYESQLILWQHISFIAYLKEQEFKEGEKIMYFPKEGELEVVEVIKVDAERIIYHNSFKGITKSRPKEMFSYYYPGQEVESFKYVREVKIHSYINKRVKPKGRHFLEWQEVEEPAEEKINLHSLIVKGRENKYTNPDYTQFQEGVEQAKILAKI